MTDYFLGVDTGATKSHALIADDTGRALGFGEGGSGNHEVVGYAGMTEVLVGITRQAMAEAAISVDQIAGAGFGLAGYDWPSERPATLDAIRPLGLSAPLEVVNDAAIAVPAGAAEGWGVAVVAGTSCNCWGWDRQRRHVGHMTGFSALMDEAAGGSEFARKALHAISRAWSRRGPATRLSEAFVEALGARDLDDLIEGFTQGRYAVNADMAQLAFRVAAEGDAVAQELVRWAGEALADLALGVIRQVGIETLAFDVVLAGSFFNGSPVLAEVMRETIQVVAPGARLVRLTAPPVAGAVLLGMEMGGLDARSWRERLIASMSEQAGKWRLAYV
jgi:N-acetylglucosamine kinase-like BadF-type ATPase